MKRHYLIMARTRAANNTTVTKPSLMSRLKGNNRTVTTSTKHSTNPITGSHTTTTTKEVGAPHSTSHHTGPTTASTGRTVGSSTRHTTGHHTSTHHTTGHHFTGTTTGRTARVQKRKPSMGDKISGAMMNLRGSVTGKPGVKAAGTRRMHGTDGKGEHYTRAY
ncbi:hypothetical protein D6C78_02091 [Aureobasidium pullulans]|uniref:Uncharacterized protein n=1 Tax=Aureobasidium pullulans TaxID=5580 RepID=A0A4T0C153_AURPU|nr:hypothetical protein D6C78_02091 [Aureobasidium pullulans]